MALGSLGDAEEDVAFSFFPNIEPDHVAIERAHRVEVVDAKRDLSEMSDSGGQSQTVSISGTG
jgi:hypothetical protein